MAINFIDGDLLDPSHGFTDICHGVNLSGVMGAGIAKSIRELYGEDFFEDYVHWCKHEGPKLGSFMYGRSPGLPILWNLATQLTPGPTANLEAVVESFTAMLTQIIEEGRDAHIGVPQIGCGIGGLDWDAVLYNLVAVSTRPQFRHLNVTFVTHNKDN